ncbi:hypothetical protein [Pararhizobium sp. IMCC21322]|uniref:hypothetical protein n=1 Tax=Pararhizobium sp. IMCC21322 TaxID=3067903 RepID=UPI0027403919|nr:hypothetical protein [Pararhizobium sp. IMCC21322]
MLAPHRGVFGFLRTELLEGRMTNEVYNAYTGRIRENFRVLESISAEFRDRGEAAQQVRESKQVWKTGDYPDPRNEVKTFRDANRARVQAEREALKASQAGQPEIGADDKGGSNSRQNLLGTPKPGDVLRAVGVIGDVVEFTQVVEESSKLIEQDRTPEAEQLLFAYVGGIGGSAAGGAAAGMAAGAAISATGVGALVGVPLAIVSVLVGGYLGDAAGREFTSYMVREIQTRQANGKAIVVDDIIELFEDYSDANDLDVEGLEIPKSELDLSGLNSQTGPWELVDENGELQPFNMGPIYGQAVDARQSAAEAVPGQTMAELQGGTAFNRVNKAHALVTTAGQSAGFEAAMGQDIDLLPHGVRKGFDRRRSQMESANGTNNEQLPIEPPTPRPRPKLNPITEGYLKDMPDDGRLILTAEIVGFNGRKEADKAEAERLARFDVQRKQKQDLEDVKVGKVSTVWDRYGHPKAVRDLLGEEAYQTFVDDRLEAGLISNATAGLHLLQDAELFGIADGTTALEAPHEKLTELMTPKVLAAAAERARDILDMRRTKPSEAVLLSSDLSNRKARFDAAFDANEAVDAEEMDAFLFYHEAAQREIGIAEPAIEMIPPRWASQVAARFEVPQAGNGTPTDRRAREAELKQHYTELQQSFGPGTDDVIAYSLARTASNGALPSGQGHATGTL